MKTRLLGGNGVAFFFVVALIGCQSHEETWPRKRQGQGLAAPRYSSAFGEPTEPEQYAAGPATRSFEFGAAPFYGLTPKLGLNYSSGGERAEGGLGWRLVGWPRISTANSTRGGEPVDASPVYLLDGEPLLDCSDANNKSASCLAGGSHFALHEDYRKYLRLTDALWQVTEPSGTQHLFEQEPNSTHFTLKRVTDTLGNKVEYIRNCQALPCKLDEVRYGESTAGVVHSLRFVWEARPDVYSLASRNGVAVVAERIKTVLIEASAGGVRSIITAYRLEYSPSTPFALSRLRVFGANAVVDAAGDVSGDELPASEFEYGSPDTGIGANINKTASLGVFLSQQADTFVDTNVTIPSVAGPGWSIADIDGNGELDWAKITSGAGEVVWMPVGTTSVRRTPANAGTFGAAYFVDINHDRRSEVLLLKSTSFELLTSDGQQLRPTTQGALFQSNPRSGKEGDANRTFVADIDGDGTVELIGIEERVGSADVVRVVRFEQDNGRQVMLTSAGPVRDETWAKDPADDASHFVSPGDWLTADLNGDGASELVLARFVHVDPSSTDADDLRLHLSVFALDASRTGIAVAATLLTNCAPGAASFKSLATERVLAGDFDGDRRTELLLVGTRGFTPVAATFNTEFSVVRLDAEMGTLSESAEVSVPPMLGSALPNGWAYYGAATALASVNLSLNRLFGDAYSTTSAFWSVGDHNGDGADDVIVVSATPSWLVLTPSAGAAHITTYTSNRQGGFVTNLVETSWVFGCGLQRCDVHTNNTAQVSIVDTDGDGEDEIHLIEFPRTTTGSAMHRFRKFAHTGDWSPQNRRFVDITADGVDDLVLFKEQKGCTEIHAEWGFDEINQKYDGMARSCLPLHAFGTAVWAEWGGKSGRDGRADGLVLAPLQQGSDHLSASVLLADGVGGWTVVPSILPLVDEYGAAVLAQGNETRLNTDLNSDGVMDVLVLTVDSASALLHQFIADGTGGFLATPTKRVGLSPKLGAFDSLRWQVDDVNGDGNPEIVALNQMAEQLEVRVIWISSGSSTRTVVDGFLVAPEFVDINADGRSDLVGLGRSGSFPTIVYRHLGTGTGTWLGAESSLDIGAHLLAPPAPTITRSFVSGNSPAMAFLTTKVENSIPKLSALFCDAQGDLFSVSSSLTTIPSRSIFGFEFTDVNGDRAPELTRIVVEPSPQGDRLVLSSVFSKARHTASLLSSGVNGLGLRETFTYGTTAGLDNSQMPLGSLVSVVKSVRTVTEPNGTVSNMDFQYTNPTWSFSDGRFAGFRVSSAITGTLRIEIERETQGPCSGAETARETKDIWGGRVSRSEQVFKSVAGLPRKCELRTSRQRHFEYSTVEEVVETQFDTDYFGNITSEIQFGRFVDTNYDGLDEYTQDNRVTTRLFSQNLSLFITNRPFDVSTADSVGQTAQHQMYGYDHLAPGAVPVRGLMTTESTWDSVNARWTTITSEYNGFGSVVGQRDDHGRERTFHYRSDNPRLPEKTCTAHICVVQNWDALRMLLESEIDGNGAKTRRMYDSFGRQTVVVLPNGGCTFKQYLDWGDPKRQRIREGLCREAFSSDRLESQYWSDTYFDGLSRPWRRSRQGVFASDTQYLGNTTRLSSQTDWHDGVASGRGVLVEFDSALRPVTSTTDDGAFEETDRAPLSITTYDQLGNATTRQQDGHGNTVELTEWVTDSSGTRSLVTRYEYDAANRRTQIVDPAGNVTSLLFSTNGKLHVECDADRGCVTHEWDESGLPISTLDARGSACKYKHDALGRLTGKHCELGAALEDVDYFYDANPTTGSAIAYGIGRLVESRRRSSRHEIVERVTYDPLGNRASEETCIDGVCVAQQRSYYHSGELEEIGLPDASGVVTATSERVSYKYDDFARPVAVLSSVLGDVFRVIEFDANDRVIESVAGNGVRTHNTLNPSRKWIDSVEHVDSSGRQLAAFSFTRDVSGMLTDHTITNGSSNSFTYTHDELGRLTAAVDSVGQSESYDYDEVGNMTYRTSVGTMIYRPGSAHILASAGGLQLAFDNSGNMIRRGSAVLDWNAFGELSGVDRAKYDYGPDGSRTIKEIGSVATKYFASNIEMDPLGDLVFHYEYRGAPIATRSATGTHANYYFHDGLDSVSIVVDDTGTVLERLNYLPFGESASNSQVSRTSFGFAGHRRDDESELVYMGARYYDPRIARFASADSVVPDVDSSQSFNRYSYVLNSPLAASDPSGHLPSDYCIGWGPCQFDERTLNQDLSEAVSELYNSKEIREYLWEAADLARETRELLEEVDLIIKELVELGTMANLGAGFAIATSQIPMGAVLTEVGVGIYGRENLPEGFEFGMALGNIIGGAAQVVSGLGALGGGGGTAAASVPLLALGGAGAVTGAVGITAVVAGTVQVSNGLTTVLVGIEQTALIVERVNGNKSTSRRPQHVYEIYDTQTGQIMKIGISSRPLGVDGNGNPSSPRADEQVRKENASHPGRFAHRVLTTPTLKTRLQGLKQEALEVARKINTFTAGGLRNLDARLRKSNGKPWHNRPR